MCVGALKFPLNRLISGCGLEGIGERVELRYDAKETLLAYSSSIEAFACGCGTESDSSRLRDEEWGWGSSGVLPFAILCASSCEFKSRETL